MGVPKGPTEGGSGGKRGHSNMEHWGYTDEIKEAFRRRRRLEAKASVRETDEVGGDGVSDRGVTSEGRPAYRPAQRLSRADAAAAFDSGDTEAIHYAIIDASRCLDAAWMYPWAVRFAKHDDPNVRWGAFFALDQIRAHILADRLEDDAEPLLLIEHAASSDPDEHVRGMASTTLLDMLCDEIDRADGLWHKLRQARRRRPPRAGRGRRR